MAFVSEQNSVAGIYNDLNGLESIKSLGRKDRDGALHELAQQFEALLVNMMLSSMRSANEAFSSDSPFNSNEAQMYQDMLDQQLTVTLSQGGGIGLAEVILRQLSPSGSVPESGAGRPMETSLLSTRRDIRTVSGRTGDEAVAPWRIDNPEQFITELQPLAQRTAAELGMPAELLLSQAALETGWGAHLLHSADGRPSFNFFNIKAGRDWQGEVVNVPTLEYRDGVAVREWAAFRAYDNAADGFADYAALVSGSPRYRAAMANSADAETYIRELVAAGYATDPHYADKVLSVMRHDAMAVARDGGEG